MKSLDCSYSAGMRFRMRFETDDASERRFVDCQACSCYIPIDLSITDLCPTLTCRFTGLIAGISDVDPHRWPGSKWKCLMV